MASELNDGYSVAQADNSRDGSIDVTERHIRASKVPYLLRGFRASGTYRHCIKDYVLIENCTTSLIRVAAA